MSPSSTSFIGLFLIIYSRKLVNSSPTLGGQRQHGIFEHGLDLPTKRPLVIAHRGSSGSLPEHTLLAYQRAIDEGADVIECDVTLTRDLVPVCLHENWLELATDVGEHAEFVERKRQRMITNSDGQQIQVVDWFAIDFTLTELKTLRKRQSRLYRDQSYNGQLEIATLDEYITLAKKSSRPVGIYPELKDPEWINSLDIMNVTGTRFEDIVLDVLMRYNYTRKQDPCLIQSFSESTITYLSTRTQLPLILLIEDTLSNQDLERWQGTLYGLGVWTNAVARHWTTESGYKNWIGRNTTDLVSRAHSYGLKVHLWTLRNEDQFLAWDFNQDIYFALDFYQQFDIDGIFSDFPLTVVRYFNDTLGESCNNQGVSRNQQTSRVTLLLTSFVATVVAMDIFYQL